CYTFAKEDFFHFRVSIAITVHWVPPRPEIWHESNITRATKRFWELEWSKSTYLKECSERVLQVVPVYFWPGERIDLPCKMCELTMAYNGKIKYWAKAIQMDEFLKAPQVRQNSNTSRLLNKNTKNHLINAEDNRKSVVAATNKLYLLYDIWANPSSQGIYFCYDEQSISNTNLFFVVLAMTPPVSIYDYDRLYGDSCDNEKHMHIEPSFNWRFRFLPTFRDYKPSHCVKGTRCASYKVFFLLDT
ncbi:unnamed protein product, partial [Angiostrongylus costaricensis]|uniref:Ig-like domain-containing protein n=1 Tax=Angiostrongylus costaricensis TaxID=334426 RepID=A0A0R3PN47_ANGCS